MKNIEDFIEDYYGIVFRFQVYKRMFTPYEIKEKFEDESVFEDGSYYRYGKLTCAYKLPNGEIIVGIRECGADGSDFKYTNFYNLNEVRLTVFDSDNEKELVKSIFEFEF